ncbi:MAG: HK97 gp10 family phage protein [Oscillospiraceae bacterium]|nr:HK97 gp10 family phage protein [Oscillospiraceae bacterium]
MAKWGSADFKQLERLQQKLAKFEELDLDALCAEISKELAARLLALVIPSTPVGKYPASSGKKGGTLRRGWTAGQIDTAAKRTLPMKRTAAYASGLNIEQIGDDYRITITNPVEYASYVEFGHRKVNGGWVDGQLFLTKAELKLESIAPGIVQKKLEARLKELFNV